MIEHAKKIVELIPRRVWTWDCPDCYFDNFEYCIHETKTVQCGNPQCLNLFKIKIKKPTKPNRFLIS